MKLKGATLLTLILTTQAHIVHAEEPALKSLEKESASYLSLSIENDNFGGGTDRFYTSGVRATWFDTNINVPPVIDTVAEKIPTFDVNSSTSTFYTLGHNIYTPEDIKIAEQPENDRPWAAFLYGSVGLANVTYNETVPEHVDELEFTLGVIGPEALGEQTQKFIHKHVTDSPIPKGWKNQLEFEPGLIVSWQRRMPFAYSHDFKHMNFRIEPSVSVSLGNVRTNIGTGATFVLGSTKLIDTPPRVRPALPGTGVFANGGDGFDWQVFAGLHGRAVARDIFLDGNTFKDSHSVDKEYFVGDVNGGVSLMYDDWRLSYTLNLRTKEFKAQDENSVFGSVTLTKRF